MCYGRISVSFLYKGKDSRRKDSTESSSMSVLPPIETATEATAELTKLSPTEEPQSHQFARTHFRSATVCDYCNKKVSLLQTGSLLNKRQCSVYFSLHKSFSFILDMAKGSLYVLPVQHEVS